MQDKFGYTYKNKLTNYDTWKGQIIQVKKVELLNKPIIIWNIYRPPKDIDEKYSEFINEFAHVLDTLETMDSEVIITGNLNIDLLKMADKEVLDEYFDMLTLPTRLSN